MVFVSSAVENFAVFSIELGTMQPVLLVDWGDGFGRLWKIFFLLYPQVFRINSQCGFCYQFYLLNSICHTNIYIFIF